VDLSLLFQKFQKRQGTTDLGKKYEELVAANFILKLLTDEKVNNFNLSSNDANFGQFDDIVLEINTDHKETYAIQLKHNNRAKSFTANHLAAIDGNFSIKKYFDSFKQLSMTDTCKFILYTNRQFNEGNKKVRMNNVILKIIKCDPIEILNTSSQNNCCYKFNIEECSSSDEETQEYRKFLQNFFLYTDQGDVRRIENIVTKIFQDKFFCDGVLGYEKYLKFIAEWSDLEGKKLKLERTLMQRVTALCILTPFIQPFSISPVNEKMKVFRQAISGFDITFFEENVLDHVRKIWGDVKSELANMEVVEDIRNNYQLTSDYTWNVNGFSDEVCYWLMDKCPLIVFENKSTYEAIRLCRNKKFVIIVKKSNQNDESDDKQLEEFSVFRTLSDLNPDSEVCKEMKRVFKCSIQEKNDITLGRLIQESEEFQSIVTTNDLAKMLEDSYQIGDIKEIIPHPYIDRYLARNLIDIKYFEKLNGSTLIVLNCVDKIDLIKNRIGNFNLMRVDVYLQDEAVKSKEFNYENNINSDHHISLFHSSPDLKKYVTGPDLFVSDTECSKEDFMEICKKHSESRICHHLRIVDNETLEWIRSDGDITDLERFRIENQFVKETEFYSTQPDNNINLINGDPGMGKSELLKNIKNNSLSTFWCVIFYPKDISSLCGHLDGKFSDWNKFVEFLLDIKYNNLKHFDKEILKILIKNKKVIYFWDALDEVSTTEMEFAINFINHFSRKGLVQWISSRCHLQKKLEKEFRVLSRNIRQFNDEEQTYFIHQRLGNLYSEEEIVGVIDKIKTTVTLLKHNDVLGTPLQIFMVTELFRQNKDKYLNLLKNVFSLTDLYHHIIEEKFNFYYEKKAEVQSPNQALSNILEGYKRNMFEKYEKAAMKTLITNEVLRKFNINCDDFLKEIQGRDDCIGLVTEVTNNFPQFLHNSYAEYFVAMYFKDHYTEINDFDSIILDTRYANIRFFFDLLTAKDSSAHIAVLYKNLELLKEQGPGLKDCKDAKGRNVLQLACSWGQRYPVLSVQNNAGNFIIDDENDDSVIGETPEYAEMLQYLLENCDALESDKVFKSTLSYAEETNCQLAKLKILQKQGLKFGRLINDSSGLNLLYYSAKFGFYEVLDLFEELPMIKTKKENFSLLHLAVVHDKEKYLQKLLNFDVYIKSIDEEDKSGRTSLYIACQDGNEKIVSLLLQFGANVDIAANNGFTPLHAASVNSYVTLVQLLLKRGANINAAASHGITPLHSACWNGHDEVVEELIRCKANLNASANDGCTSLYIASRNKHNRVVKLLLNAGADKNFAQEDGVTPLLIASQEGHKKNVEALLKFKADVNIASASGETPLYVACQNGHVQVAQNLIEAGADINAATNRNWTPLLVACQQEHAQIVELLLRYGADVNKKVDPTPFSVANFHGHDKIFRLLAEYEDVQQQKIE
jgi:ankyrin repeat protein